MSSDWRTEQDCTHLINAAFAETSRDEVLRLLQAGGVPAGAIRSIGEVYDWEQTKSQGLLLSVEHPVAGSVNLPGPAIRLEDVRGKSVRRPKHISPPLLGQHNESIARWLASVEADSAISS